VHPWDDVAIAQAVDAGTAALLAVASHVSPVPDAPGTWWVGVSGYVALGGATVSEEFAPLRARPRSSRPCRRVPTASPPPRR
jgi:hypothetical protein